MGELGQRLRVLAVDDDPQALRYVSDALTKAGYAPLVTGDPEEALRLVGDEEPDLVLLDMMLPGADGIELMKDILETAEVPVIFLSAYGQAQLVARALDMGAVDYIAKPFSPTELAARIRAALRRRAASETSEPYVLGGLVVNYGERRVTLAGRPLQLTAIEYRLLAELSANAGRVLTYEHLLQRVWGDVGDGGRCWTATDARLGVVAPAVAEGGHAAAGGGAARDVRRVGRRRDQLPRDGLQSSILHWLRQLEGLPGRGHRGRALGSSWV